MSLYSTGVVVEAMTARELRKEIRRLQHLGRGRSCNEANARLAELESRYEERARFEKEVMEVKGAITRTSKLLKAEANEEERQALETWLLQLKERYTQLTGEAEYAKRKASPTKKSEVSLGLASAPEASSFEPWTPRDYFRFEVVHESTKSRARAGLIYTPHGVIETPCFVPVGTNGALKCVDSEQADRAGVQLMFCNTYHLLVHPGADIVQAAGGLHEYMRRDRPIITDSGGFQVFSLADSDSDEDGPELKSKRVKRRHEEHGGGGQGQLLSVTERGTIFRSYLDGSTIELTPESSVEAQKKLGADIIIPLDELPPYHVTRERLEASVALSHRWMARSLRVHLADKRKQAMYAVVHGGVDKDLRKHSIEYLGTLPFDGYAIGGSLGKDRDEMLDLLTYLMPLVPRDKPNHLLGIADPDSVRAIIPLGVDTFDSCNPTRVARHGTLMTTAGSLKVKQSQYASDFGPIDPEVRTVNYSRAYLHHLFKQNEPIALTIASMHNIMYMNHLISSLRSKIINDEI